MKEGRLMNMWLLFLNLFLVITLVSGCQFYPYGEYLRFIRVPENTAIGEVILQVEVHPRHNLSIQPLDRIEDATYFAFQDINSSSIGVVLYKSLDDLVDRENPQNVLKFRMVCESNNDGETLSSYVSVTVYVEDVNDHVPKFIDAPYAIAVDELTPVGVTVFRHIHAFDRDKPNTPNSEVHYAIVAGNEGGHFALETPQRPFLVLTRPIDYDKGEKEFVLTVAASDRGSPPRNTTVPVTITVGDNDDLPPVFTREIYKTHVKEFYPITGRRVNQELRFKPAIRAYDADLGLNAAIRYDIVSGNERQLFYLHPSNASLFLRKEIDLDREVNLPGNTFVLQIQATQKDNPLKTGVARLEVELLDLNDNPPEFEVDLYNISIVENLPNGFSVLQVIASDKDQGDNAEFSYDLEDSSHAFNIDTRTGWLTVRDQTILDRERQPSLGMKVFAREKMPSIISDGKKKSATSSVMVEVTLLDANDNNPIFTPSNLYEFRIPSDALLNDIVGQVKATDPDLGRNGMVLYALQKSNSTAGQFFAVDAQSGQIRVTSKALPTGRHALFVEASDQPANPSERRFSLAVVTVDVVKAGKAGVLPDFAGAPYEWWVGGDVAIGTSVGQVRVTDAVDKSRLVYDLLHSYHEGVPFAVEERSGVITVVDELKKFDRSLYDFEAVVTDTRDVNLVTNVTIHVVDPVQFADPFLLTGPQIEGGSLEFRVRENLSGALVGSLLKPQKNVNNITAWWKSVRFIIANQQDVMDKFAVSADGSIYTLQPLDREQRDVYRLTILAESSRGLLRGAGIYQVSVIVEDDNDNPPMFEERQYEGHISENSVGGTEVNLTVPVKAHDADSGYNAQFKFTLYGEGSELFTLDQTTGQLFVLKGSSSTLDREEKSVYNLRIVARDKGNLNSEVKLVIYVDDVNDNAPKFLQMVVLHDQDVEIMESLEKKLRKHSMYVTKEQSNGFVFGDGKVSVQLPPMVSLPENIHVGTFILRLLAHDKDSNSTITYYISEQLFMPRTPPTDTLPPSQKYFMIGAHSGEVAVASALSAEAEYRLTVTAVDMGGLSDNVTIRVYVRDINDHSPVFTESSYDFELIEGRFDRHVVGTVKATDADFDENANVTYSMKTDNSDNPFLVESLTGEILLSGDVDREVRQIYTFEVIAIDNPIRGSQLSTTVLVQVNIQDINDNPPVFYGYDSLIEMPEEGLDGMDKSLISKNDIVPVYYASINEKSRIGSVVTRVFANDSDFAGNGNGLIIFDLAYAKYAIQHFQIDSKDGIITLLSKLDYEKHSSHNLTIVASDLGRPSLSSVAVLVVNVIDAPEEAVEPTGAMFTHRYYEVEVEENVAVPLLLLTLNVSQSYKGENMKYQLIDSRDRDAFRVDEKNGSVYLEVSPDRETKPKYEVKIRGERMRRGREMDFIYPPPLEKLSDVGLNEVKVVLRVKDVNDNSPRFKLQGRPIVAAVPSSAHYGYIITTLKATDADEGVNGDIRYQILGRGDSDSHRFSIDPLSGQVRSISSFSRDAGKIYGFDVKATDRRGADIGRSAIANVFVYVLDEAKQVVLVLGSKASAVERNIDAVTGILRNTTGVDVRVRKIEPHIHSDADDGTMTDVYLYAVDPLMNTIIEMDVLQQVMDMNSGDLKRRLDAFRTVDFLYMNEPPPPRPRDRVLLSALEIAVVVLGCIVFIGALSAAVCVGCARRETPIKRDKLPKPYTIPNSGFTLSKGIVKAPHLFPGPAYLDTMCPGDTTDTYVEMHSNKSGHCGQRHRRHRHEPTCYRHHHRHRRSNSTAGIHYKTSHTGRLETSLTSLHSSGKDSGITEGHRTMCPCGHSTSNSSADSSNGSYEDSLKSLQRRSIANLQELVTARRASIHERPRHRPQSGVPPPPPPAPPRIHATPTAQRRF